MVRDASLYSRKKAPLNTTGYIRIFPPEVWLLLIGSVPLLGLMNSVALAIVERGQDCDAGHIFSVAASGFSKGVSWAYATLLQFGVGVASSSKLHPSQKVLLLSAYSMATLMFIHFTGVLTAYMTARSTPLQINTFQVTCRFCLVHQIIVK